MHFERHFAFQNLCILKGILPFKNLCILKGILPFEMHKVIFFSSENLKEILGFNRKFGYGQVTLNTGIFFICP